MEYLGANKRKEKKKALCDHVIMKAYEILVMNHDIYFIWGGNNLIK